MSDRSHTIGGLNAAGFASPHGLLSQALLDLVVGEHSRALTRRFLTAHGPALKTWSSGLGEVLEAFESCDASFQTTWDLSVGHLAAALHQPWGLAPQVAVAELALRLHACGMAGRWECLLLDPARLRSGAALLAPADRLCVQADNGRVAVESSLSGRPTATPEALAQVTHGGQALTLLTSRATNGPAFAGALTRGPAAHQAPHHVPAPLASVGEPLLAGLHSALEMLSRHAPEYRDWVMNVVRYIVPLTPVPELQISSSTDDQPATVGLSAHPRPAELAEMLVHESSHQYLYILTRLGPLDDGSDPTLYFSPVKGTRRPIRAILVAYHAVANILLWTRAALATHVDDAEYFVDNAAALPDKLAILEEALGATRALTALGRLLWEPLHERIWEPSRTGSRTC